VTRRGAGPALAIALAGGLARVAPAQVAANRAAAYLPVTDVGDVRALWVNPAGLAVGQQAAVLFDLTVLDPGTNGRLAQFSTGFNARGLAFGYQRDMFAGGIHGHTYRLGVGGVSRGLAFGVDLAVYRGATSGVGWDFGVRYDWHPALTLGAVWRDVGQPTVRGVPLRATLVPGITIRPLGANLAVSAQSALTSSGARGYALEARAALPTRSRIALLARLDADRNWHRQVLVFGLAIGRTNEVGLVGSFPSASGSPNVVSAYGVATRAPAR